MNVGKSQPDNDFGTDEARQRSDWIVEQPDPRDRSTRRVRVLQDQIDFYLKRSYITLVEGDALRRWQSDAYLAGLMPSATGNYNQRIMGGQAELSDQRLAAQARRDNAIAFLTKLSPHAVPLVDAVAVTGTSAGRWIVMHMGGSPHEAIEWLRKFAAGLAKHYGFAR